MESSCPPVTRDELENRITAGTNGALCHPFPPSQAAQQRGALARNSNPAFSFVPGRD
jgi:hypothetical protein